MTMLYAWVHTPFANVAGWALFHSLWQGALVAAALALALAAVRSARARYAVACAALLVVVAGFAITFAVLAARSPAAASLPAHRLALAGSPDEAAIAAATVERRISDLLSWAAPFWIAGVVVLYLKNLGGWATARRLRRVGVCGARDPWQERIHLLAARLRVSRPVVLLESSLAEVPIVVGHLRPVILMPLAAFAGLPPGQIESILLHELAHIRRCDYFMNILQTVVESLLFYHPAVWWISGVIRAEREHCCDDMAVAITGDAHEYALALTAVEAGRAPQAAMAATGGTLIERIRRLLAAPEGPSPALTPVFAAGILMVVTAAALAAWQAQPPVSPYQKWLSEDVVYIITAQERQAYLSLGSDAERDHFIEQFWLRRDPTPGTPENEYKVEHYRRIAFANLHFATAQGAAGWRTDRGRIYITFGPPDELDAHAAGPGVPYPYERWQYRYLEGLGNNIFMDFVDTAATGEFRMTRDPNPPR